MYTDRKYIAILSLRNVIMLAQCTETERIRPSTHSNDDKSRLVSLLLAVNSQKSTATELKSGNAAKNVAGTAGFVRIFQKWPDTGPLGAVAEVCYIPSASNH